MTGQSRRVVLRIESMESRNLLSGVHTLDIATSDVAFPRGTDARDKVALLEIRHSDARLGSDLSGARGQYPLGETRGDVHANAIGGKVRSGDAPKVASTEPANVFRIQPFSVAGLDGSAGNQGSVNYNTSDPQPYVPGWQVTVTTRSDATHKTQLLDLWFQRDTTKAFVETAAMMWQNRLLIGKLGVKMPIQLNLQYGQTVEVRYLFYLSIRDMAAVTTKKLGERVIFPGSTPEFVVFQDPFSEKKVFPNLTKPQTYSYATSGPNPKLDWPKFSSNEFFILGDLKGENARTMGLAMGDQYKQWNGIHLDALVTFD